VTDQRGEAERNGDQHKDRENCAAHGPLFGMKYPLREYGRLSLSVFSLVCHWTCNDG
jgi:hypothetical protein